MYNNCWLQCWGSDLTFVQARLKPGTVLTGTSEAFKQPAHSRHTAGTALITSNLLKSVLLGTDGMASCGHLLGSKLMTGHLQGKVPDHEGCSGLAMY